jgi:hypothetical protein
MTSGVYPFGVSAVRHKPAHFYTWDATAGFPDTDKGWLEE